MKKSLLVVGHLESGSSILCESLNRDKTIHWCHSGMVYNHIDCLAKLSELDVHCSFLMDELIHNHSFNCKSFYNISKFIYVIRDANCLYSIVKNKNEENYAYRNYVYRLRRICEMARTTPGAVLITYNDLSNKTELIKKYLSLNDLNIELPECKNSNKFVSFEVFSKAQESYEKYYCYLKKLDLLF